jgi:hypothetical protein
MHYGPSSQFRVGCVAQLITQDVEESEIVSRCLLKIGHTEFFLKTNVVDTNELIFQVAG